MKNVPVLRHTEEKLRENYDCRKRKTGLLPNPDVVVLVVVYLMDGSSQTVPHATKLKQKLQIKLAISPRHRASQFQR